MVLARLESDDAEYQTTDAETGDPKTTVGTIRQDMVVTRFDAAGRGTDLVWMQAIKPFKYSATYLGGVTLSASGKTALVQTRREVLRLNLNARTGRQYALKGVDQYTDLPSYQLLPDGTVAAFINLFDHDDKPYYTVDRFLPTGQVDTAFADDGVLSFRPAALGDGYNQVTQVFLGASGHLYVLATGFIGTSTTLALRRV